MHVDVCWFGLELDFRADLTGVSFYLGRTTVDDDVAPDPVPVRGDSVSIPIGYAPSPQPDWEKPLNRWDEPDESTEDV